MHTYDYIEYYVYIVCCKVKCFLGIKLILILFCRDSEGGGSK